IAVERLLNGRDRARLAALQALGAAAGVPCVAAGDVQMHARKRRRLHNVLTAIRLGTTVQAAGYALTPNGERSLRRLDTLKKLYPPELLAETLRIAERCTFSLDELRYEYPEEIVPPGETPASYLRRLTQAGAAKRWPDGVPEKVRALIERELALIADLKYEPYFLTVYDVVDFARRRNILCQGRGSAANSAVCFCLGITEVDPARIDTLFERFISKERNEPPDIDVDFEHERREEVIQYIYDKYGRERAALAATVITYRLRSAVRDVGKALGFSLEQVDRLAKNFQWWDSLPSPPAPLPEGEGSKHAGSGFSERVREMGFDPSNPRVLQFVELVREIVGFPRHLSQHVGGFVIARDSLARLVPIENAAMPARTVIQWDKDDLDALGLLKVDVLGLGMLTVIRKALALIARRGGPAMMAAIPPEDPKVYGMICHADTVGVFQIESRAQMAMLPRLKPVCFYDLVIEIAIVRPGPIQGDMVHPYLRRREGRERVAYPSAEVRAVLGRTLGVPIFQEQVIKLAMVAAGFTPGEADGLRRSMAAWRRKGGLEVYEKRLIDGMRARGYAEQFARQIFQQIQGFGEYGFPESHSASFALLAYVSAWIKCYEPAAFLCALLNSQPMGFYAPSQLVQDARRHGVEVLPADVRVSEWDCTLQPSPHPSPGGRGGDEKRGGASFFSLSLRERAGVRAAQPSVRLGLRQVKGFSEAAAERIVAARAERPFASVADLARRAQLNRRELDALAAANALAALAGHRHRARWSVAGVEPPLPLLAESEIPEAQPMLRAPTEAQDIIADYASLKLTLGRHPLALLRRRFRARGWLTSDEVRAASPGRHIRTTGLVVCRQHPSSASGVIFLTLEDEHGNTNVIVWPSLVARARRALTQARLLTVFGEVQREGEVLHVIAKRLEDHSGLLGELQTASRDFH
ncbi:MAG: error-prone DNA polymerase, partial [Gammaproteobacteria bacterium]